MSKVQRNRRERTLGLVLLVLFGVCIALGASVLQAALVVLLFGLPYIGLYHNRGRPRPVIHKQPLVTGNAERSTAKRTRDLEMLKR